MSVCRCFFALMFCFNVVFAGCQRLPVHSAQTPFPRDAGVVTSRCPDVTPLSDLIVADSIHVTPERLAALKAARSLSNQDICRMPEKGLKRAFSKLDLPKADHPGEWAEFRNLQRRSEDGNVKPDGLMKGARHRSDNMQQQAEALAVSIASGAPDILPGSAGITSSKWTSLGPGSVGGRIRAIAIDPNDSNKIFVGGVAGGIWKSTNAGVSWNPVSDFMANIAISTLIIDPTNSNTLYAGTGEGFYNGDAVRGYGIYKTTDGGTTWNFLSSTTPSSVISSQNYNWFYVNKLAISNDGTTVLAATRGYYTNSGGIYRSTDGGASWAQTYSSARILDIRIDPNDKLKAVANAIGYNFSTSLYESYILKSTDGGQSWVKVQTFTSSGALSNRVELTYTKANSQILYASRDNAQGEVWKSIDGGSSWNLVSTPAHLGNQGWYSNTIWASPSDPALVVAGGLDIWRSTDSGATWTRISNWTNNMYYGYPNVPHADQHILISDPGYNGTSNKKLYNGNDGGIFRAADVSLATEASGWERLNNGLAITQFYSGAGFTAAGGRIIGGAQDNGSQVKSITYPNWHLFNGGDGGFSAVDSQNDNYFYGEYVYLALCRTTDGGASSANIYSGITDATVNTNANFIAPFILDPNDNNRMLAGGLSLWQSLAVKAPTPAWTAIKPSTGQKISAIAVAKGNSSITWVGHNNGTVYQSSNSLMATPTWTQVGSGAIPARMVNRILIDDSDPTRVYVALGGYNADNLYMTTNSGANWTNITGNLPAVPIFTIARHPSNASWLYAGTEVGLFTSENGGATWFTTNDGPANVEISELSWMDSTTLLASTHGRGMFRASASVVVDTTPPTIQSVTPAASAGAVDVTGNITAVFSEALSASTITSATFSLNHGVTGAVSYDPATLTATLTPSAPLAVATSYTATITTGVKDLAGNAMTSAYTWNFTTGAALTANLVVNGDFENGMTNWSLATVAGAGAAWNTVSSGDFPVTSAHSGSAMADFNSFSVYPGNQARLYQSSGLALSPTYGSVNLSFWMYHDTDYPDSNDRVQLQVSTDGSSWTNVGSAVSRYDGTTGWAQVTIDLSAYKGQSNLLLGFLGMSEFGNDIYLDDVSLRATIPAIPAAMVKIKESGAGYNSITAAYTSALSGNTIEAQTTASPFIENLLISKVITLQGGFDAGFISNSGYTALNGLITVGNGGVLTVEKFILN